MRKEVISMKVDVKRIAVTGGIIWGVILFVTTLLGVYWGYGMAFLNGMVSIYPGFTVSPVGSIVGAIYGFFDVFIGVYIFAWVYQKVGK